LHEISFKQQSIYTLQGQVTAYDLQRALKLTQQRNSFANVFVNGINMGVYNMVEELDKRWLHTYFKSNKGNLYQGTWYATLNYRGDDPKLYQNWNISNWNGRWICFPYEQKGDGNFQRFADLVAVLSQQKTPDRDFSAKILEIFDVEKYLRYLIADIMLGYVDGYACGDNNFYLYDNPTTGLFEFIGYGYSSDIFGFDDSIPKNATWDSVVPQQWCNYSASRSNGNHMNPLNGRILKDPIFLDKFNKGFRYFLDIVYVNIEERIRTISKYLQFEFGMDQFAELDKPNYIVNEKIEVEKLINFWKNRYANANIQIPK